jgi:hypothetical protein
MDELFEGPWYLRWKAKVRDSDVSSDSADTIASQEHDQKVFRERDAKAVHEASG